MKNFYLLFFIFPFLGFGQEKAAKLGAFSTLETNIGLDLAQMIRDGRAKTDYEKSQLPPGKYNYGFTAQIGVQPLNWFALGGGLRYSYIDPNYHLLYAMVQPKFFLGDPRDEEFFYLFGSMGTKINRTAADNAGFVGIGAGMVEPLSKRFGHLFSVAVEDQILDGEGSIFISLSYGIIIFSNKNL